MLVNSADPEKKKATCRASYNASPEKKRAVIGLILRRRGQLSV